MEINILAQLMPALQAQTVRPGQGKGNSPPPDFAGLLTMLQSMPGLGPEAAAIALQLGGLQENGVSLLPALFASLLPEAAVTNGPGGPVSGEETAKSVDWAAFGLPGAIPLHSGPSGGEMPQNGDAATVATVSGVQAVTGAVLTEASVAATAASSEGSKGKSEVPGETDTKPIDSLQLTAKKITIPVASEAEGSQAQGNGTESGKKPEQIPELLLKAAESARNNRAEPKGNAAEHPQPSVPNQAATSFRAALQTPAVQYGHSQISRADIVEQVLDKMVLTREPDGDSTLYVRLKPAVLGEVEIRLRMENGQLTARIFTENIHVKEALDAALGQVRQRLEAQQIHVSEMSVTVGQEHNSRQGKPLYPAWEYNSGRGNGYGIPESEESFTRPAGIVSSLLDMRA